MNYKALGYPDEEEIAAHLAEVERGNVKVNRIKQS